MKINTNNSCDIIIFDDTEYPVKGLDYDKSVSLYIAQLNESNKTTILYNQLDDHQNSDGKPIHLEPLKGGYMTMCHVILPKEVATETPSENTYYFSDGINIYKRTSEGSEQIDEQELIEVNPEVFGLRIQIQNFFSVCYLRKCYVSLCQKIFNNRAFDRCFNGKIDSQLIYKRDLVWAALNVIQYMIDSNQLAEAQRLLERINSCNGLCSHENTGERNCGCE